MSDIQVRPSKRIMAFLTTSNVRPSGLYGSFTLEFRGIESLKACLRIDNFNTVPWAAPDGIGRWRRTVYSDALSIMVGFDFGYNRQVMLICVSSLGKFSSTSMARTCQVGPWPVEQRLP